jgi:hypothetical protein
VIICEKKKGRMGEEGTKRRRDEGTKRKGDERTMLNWNY